MDTLFGLADNPSNFLDSQPVETLKIVLFLISVVMAALIAYLAYLRGELTKKENARYHKMRVVEKPEDTRETHIKEAWTQIVAHLAEESESEWKLAVLEADVLLDNMLSDLGYLGESVADKLKAVKKENMATREFAWEAHKVRNRIAHDGAAFHIDRTRAERVINLYKRVFNEFDYI